MPQSRAGQRTPSIQHVKKEETSAEPWEGQRGLGQVKQENKSRRLQEKRQFTRTHHYAFYSEKLSDAPVSQMSDIYLICTASFQRHAHILHRNSHQPPTEQH